MNCSGDPPSYKPSQEPTLSRHRLARPESALLCVAGHRCGRERFCSDSCDWCSIDPNKPLRSDAVRVGCMLVHSHGCNLFRHRTLRQFGHLLLPLYSPARPSRNRMTARVNDERRNFGAFYNFRVHQALGNLRTPRRFWTLVEQRTRSGST